MSRQGKYRREVDGELGREGKTLGGRTLNTAALGSYNAADTRGMAVGSSF